jgi:hypothetical protein
MSRSGFVTSEQKLWHVHSLAKVVLWFLMHHSKIGSKTSYCANTKRYKRGPKKGTNLSRVPLRFWRLNPILGQKPRFSAQNLEAFTGHRPFLPSKLTPTLFRCQFPCCQTRHNSITPSSKQLSQLASPQMGLQVRVKKFRHAPPLTLHPFLSAKHFCHE